MTIRLPVNVKRNNFRDGQLVDEQDLDDEQNYNVQTDNAIVNNFFGSGLLIESPNINVIFDSDVLTAVQAHYVATHDFDGRGIDPTNQPTDTVLGNQLEIILSDADVSLRRNVAVCVIGTDFQNNLQYERFAFYANESQVGKIHFKTVISILFNDFKGNNNGSRELGGRIIVREAASMQLSRDEITASQNFEPNLFFRDFIVVDQTVGPNPSTVLATTLQTALGTSGYTVDAMNINIGYVDKESLVQNDITTRYGQKFQAKVNNIQKARILLGVEHDYTQPNPDHWFDWSGDIIVSVHALQTTVSCPTDTIPDNAIDYQPFPAPLVQIILTQATLFDAGITLTDIAQPIDISFLNTRLSSYINTGIIAGNYYVITVQRAGDASVGNLFTLTGRDYTENSVFTAFNGSTWTDNSSLDLWFEIYSDCLKVASGTGYDAGTGISIDKTMVDADTGATIDYSDDGIPFANNGQGVLNYAVVQAVNELIDSVQDARTGSPVFSRQQSAAEISTVISTQLASLETTSDPIILGCAADYNNRLNVVLNKTQNYIGLVGANSFCIINPDADLLVYNLVGAKFDPNIANPNAKEYLIYKADLCVDGYGDLNGDGYIGADDVLRIAALVGESIYSLTTQAKIVAGLISALELLRGDIDGDGVITINDVALITDIYNKNITTPLPYGNSFQRLCLSLENLSGRNDGYHSSWDGYARLWSPNPRNAQYGVDPSLPIGSYTLNYYGYPVPVDVETGEAAYTTVPYVPTNYRITIKPMWRKELVKTNYTGRLLPCTFTDLGHQPGTALYVPGTIRSCLISSLTYCTPIESFASCFGGQNTFYIPNDVIIGGKILAPDGRDYALDLEVNTITLKLPALPIPDKSLDVFSLFVCESAAHKGFTTAGYPAMRFADCAYIQSNALALNQIRFSVALESLCIEIDGYDVFIPDGYGIAVDPLIGTNIDPTTGVLTIRGTNINSDPDITLNCKILITVYIKRAGWKNNHLEVLPNELQNLLGI